MCPERRPNAAETRAPLVGQTTNTLSLVTSALSCMLTIPREELGSLRTDLGKGHSLCLSSQEDLIPGLVAMKELEEKNLARDSLEL